MHQTPSRSLILVILLMTGLCSLDQEFGQPVRLNMAEKVKSFTWTRPMIVGDRAYRFTEDDAKKAIWRAAVFSLSGKGSGKEMELDAVRLKGRSVGSDFLAKDGALWQLVKDWDVRSGKVTLTLHRRALETCRLDGESIELGVISLDPKFYTGTSLAITYIEPEEGDRGLFYFDAIQVKGMKLAMCWVVGKDMQLEWSGVYPIPVQAFGAESSTQLTPSGFVIARVNAIVLTDENTKEMGDGSFKVKESQQLIKRSDVTWYIMRDSAMVSWDGKVPGSDTPRNGIVYEHQGEWRFFGDRGAGEDEGAAREWVCGHMDGSFRPVEEASGPSPSYTGRWIAGANGTVYRMWNTKQEEVYNQMSADGSLLWSHTGGWTDTHRYKLLNGKLTSITVGSNDGFERLKANGSVFDRVKAKGSATKSGDDYDFPFLVVWADGERKVLRPFPENMRNSEKPLFTTDHSNKLTATGWAFTADWSRPDMLYVPLTW